MKLRYSLSVVGFICLIFILVVNFTNCAGVNRGSDELDSGEYTFNDYASCVKGKLCESPEEIMCYDPEHFFELSPGTICQKGIVTQ